MWRRQLQDLLAGVRRPALALDYDGTLAPFRAERGEARPAPETLPLLHALSRRICLGVISGRPLAELDRLLGDLAQKVFLAGAHGWEVRPPGGPAVLPPVPPELQAEVAAAERRAHELLPEPADRAADRVEKKRAGVAAHVRGMPEESAGRWLAALRPAWAAFADRGLQLIDFDGGIELRVPARDKGRALSEFLAHCPDADLAIYVGDDRTDEDAFRALPARGLGVKVGPGATAADLSLPGIEAVPEFLARLFQAVEGGADEQTGGGLQSPAAHRDAV